MAIWKTSRSAGTAEPGPILFLDRDGVVIADRDYLQDADGVELLPGAAAAMAAARRAGFSLIGVSNQSGLGRGLFGPDDFAAVMERLEDLLEQEGTGFDAFFYCPHAPADRCDCRKPQLGLFTEATARFPCLTARSWMVGDKASDIAFGRAADLNAILVMTGHGTEQRDETERRWSADPRVHQAVDLAAAVGRILARGPEGCST
jgi:D-glycero-D-manno-heptose 1,7-bisphosphate phosphatase